MGARSETHTCRECATRGDDGTNQRFDCWEARGLWTYARRISPLVAHPAHATRFLLEAYVVRAGTPSPRAPTVAMALCMGIAGVWTAFGRPQTVTTMVHSDTGLRAGAVGD